MAKRIRNFASHKRFTRPIRYQRATFRNRLINFCHTWPKTAGVIFVILGIVVFTLINTVIYKFKKGFIINEIKLSKTLVDEGMTNESVRTILKQRIETYITNFALLQGDRFRLDDEIFPSIDRETNLTFNTAIGPISYSQPVKWVGKLLGGNDQDVIDITITDDEISYECYLRIEKRIIWNCKSLKANFLNNQYAFKDLLLNLSKRILEISHPFLMADYYCNTDQVEEGLKLADNLMRDNLYKLREKDSSVIFAFYQRLGYFNLIKNVAERRAASYPNDLIAQRILLFDAIENDSPILTVRDKIFALNKINPNDPYLITHQGLYYVKRKMYDSAFAYFSQAAESENKFKYTPEHYWEIQKLCAFTAYLNSRMDLADSFFYQCGNSEWICENVQAFNDSLFVKKFISGKTSVLSAFGNFILGVQKGYLYPKDAMHYFSLSYNSAPRNWIVKLALASSYIDMKKYHESDSLISEILANSPNHYLALAERARLYSEKKDYINAYFYARRSLETRFLSAVGVHDFNF